MAEEVQMWSIEHSYIEPWLDAQDDETVACIFAALEILQCKGPALGRPLVDTVKGSRLKNFKELRPASPGGSEIRILFVFDANREAVLLLGGDKSKGERGRLRWSGWYRMAVAKAERIYEEYCRNSTARRRNGRFSGIS
ncbi:MAG: type II toxin-antitoxin system RelE/ParE family toxin [Slackia piriformis]|uniref:Type II toxin-antitoxin system RelE/ParE family toxin n=1 Tax=Slackia piriformis TaxID=626934 RepID=A0A943USD4_9ACTN|nr:type II toxin-antitoxin system RelE/ParE family toxin [Slackia piriformis]